MESWWSEKKLLEGVNSCWGENICTCSVPGAFPTSVLWYSWSLYDIGQYMPHNMVKYNPYNMVQYISWYCTFFCNMNKGKTSVKVSKLTIYVLMGMSWGVHLWAFLAKIDAGMQKKLNQILEIKDALLELWYFVIEVEVSSEKIISEVGSWSGFVWQISQCTMLTG